MTKFGELIGVETPILINFYKAEKSTDNLLNTLKEVSSKIGQRAKIIKIEITKNELLADALKIEGNSTFKLGETSPVSNLAICDWRILIISASFC